MLRQKIEQLIEKIVGKQVRLEQPPQPDYGDYSTNIALQAKIEPAEIIEKLKDNPLFEKIEKAGPGFINFYLSKQALEQELTEIIKKEDDYGQLDLGKGKKVQVEFISANPTGPLTLGNGRGGFLGDTLANVLQKSGYLVQREYFINDVGHQIEVLVHSILGDEKAQYKGEYIEQLRKEKELKLALQIAKSDLNLASKEIGEMAVAIIWNSMIRPTIENRMKIKFDTWAPESQLHKIGIVQKVLELLKEKNLTYEKEGAIWFKSSEFGDDKDRVLVTSSQTEKNGEPTYFLADIAYHYDKFVNRKFDKVIDIWGADHHGYMARLQAAGKAFGAWDKNSLKIIIIQLVRLFKGDKEVRMSKRSGTYVTLDELLDEIPLDVARFFFLMYSFNTHMDFNLDLARERSEKNPVYYVQYAHARICSILRKSNVILSQAKDLDSSGFALRMTNLDSSAELALIRHLIKFPEIIEDTAQDYQVQRLPHYALELANNFHQFYEQCRVLDEKDKHLTQARLGLVKATQIVLRNVLSLMGIKAPEKM